MGGTWDFSPSSRIPVRAWRWPCEPIWYETLGGLFFFTSRTASSCRWVARSTSVRVQARCLTLINWARDCRRAGRHTARHDVNKFHRPTAAGDVGDGAACFTPARPDNARGGWAERRRLGPNTTWRRSMSLRLREWRHSGLASLPKQQTEAAEGSISIGTMLHLHIQGTRHLYLPTAVP